MTELQRYQARVDKWVKSCFGEAIAADKAERSHRFLEEALELVQAIGACSQDDAHKLVDYVLGRPMGESIQEVGGVMVTLSALCNTAEIDISASAWSELDRIWLKMDQIRHKQATKPIESPLPA